MEESTFLFFGEQVEEFKYGENPQQTPAFLFRGKVKNKYPLAISNWEHVAGTKTSFNNAGDFGRMIQTITHIGAGFDKNFRSSPLIALAVKHGNACGCAIGEDEKDVLKRMIIGDVRSIHGGLVIVNFPITEELADILLHYATVGGNKRLLDLVAAPSFTKGAIELMRRRNDKCRFKANRVFCFLIE